VTTVTEHTPQPARCGVTPTLRGYQTALLSSITDHLRQYRKPLVVSPTGSGKTVLFCHLARHYQGRVCILMHRAELIEQTSRALGDTPHGIIQAGRAPNPHARVQLASVQTLVNRLHLYAFDLIIVDEAHHTTARTYQRVMTAYPFAALVGVTATPCRTDGTGLRDAGYTDLILGPSVASLTEQGYLCPAQVYAPSSVDLSGIRTARGDYVRGELAAACDKPSITGNAIEHYRRYADRQPAIAFCVSVAHAEHMAEQFREAGYRAISIDGTMSTLERRQRITALSNGGLHVLTSCDLISEGVDVPVVAAGIMLRPTQSMALWLQQVGRCLRPAQGKLHAVILDHVGNTLRHGLPDAPQQWTLDGETRTRAQRAADDAPVRICLECFRAHVTAAECPYCGFVYPAKPREIEEQPGELSLLDAAWAATKPVMPGMMEEFQAASLADFQRIAEERGYKAGWAYHRWQAKQRRTA